MKKKLFYLLLLLVATTVSGQTIYNQLCTFNPNWKKYESRAPRENAVAFKNDQEYIQKHLNAVLQILKTNSTKRLTKQQKHSRRYLIRVLAAYRKAGNFPKNYYRKERLPVFIDEHGTHCAVAHLLQKTGNETMALRIAAADNYAWVKDIKDPELLAWQKQSGLTLEELKLIQGAYDSYLENAFILPNRFEIPQKPGVMAVYFEEKKGKKNDGTIWCKGEGANGILNGKWIQNYAIDFPWIEGYYENGKRTGLWKEYYQGTNQLCRTENWRDDKLNGIRKRYNKNGLLIEEIMFKNGKAILKTNYESSTSLKWVRKPLDSNVVYTEVYTMDGSLLAAGNEKIYNPGDLQWFQNIELTALNTFSVAADRVQPINYVTGNSNSAPAKTPMLYDMPPLVEYKKIGNWIYYNQYYYINNGKKVSSSYYALLKNFSHFGAQLYSSIGNYEKMEITKGTLDSIAVNYLEDKVTDFQVFGKDVYAHLKIFYNKTVPEANVLSINKVFLPARLFRIQNLPFTIYENIVSAVVGQYNKNGDRIGEWKHFDESGRCYKTENYLIPRKEEELLLEESVSTVK